MAIRLHRPVPLPVRPPDPRHGLDPGHHGERLRHDRAPDLSGHDQVLGQALRHQLCVGRHHRSDHGVPVRHELVLLLPLRGRRLRRPSGHRGADGLLSGVHLHRALFPRLGAAHQATAPCGHLPDGPGLQSLGPVDPHRQRLDAEPGRLGVQLPDHAHGDGQLQRAAAQPGGPGQVRAHRGGRLCHRIHVRAGDLVLLHAKGARPGFCQTLLLGGCGLRAGLDPVRDPARRRERLRGRRRAEDQAGGHRGGVGDRTGARRLHPDRLPRQRDPGDPRRHQGPLPAGADRHPLPGHPGDRAQGPDRRARATHPLRHDRLPVPGTFAQRPGHGGQPRDVRRPQAGPRLWPATQGLHRQPGRGHGGTDQAGGQGLHPRGGAPVLELPDHGRSRGLDAVIDRARLLLQRQAGHRTEALAAAAVPPTASRYPGSPSRPAGSSPSSAVSPGPSARCCRHPWPPPASPART